MCGICGAVQLAARGRSFALEPPVRRMLAAMRHRGPDGGAIAVRPGLAMAANRLAIRAVDCGRPPLVACEQGILVACNGEIDNYRELTAVLQAHGQSVPAGSDVSVIGPLYLQRGLDFLTALHGVFALALWDPRKRRLILARDRAGERHLHYRVADGAVCFASELAALFGSGIADGTMDPATVARYLVSGFCPAPHDPVIGCRKVRPGEMVVLEAAGAHHRRFADAPLGKAPKAKPSPVAFDDAFRSAVRHQTDVDVRYGVLLSGGVDSSLVAAVTRSVRPGRPLTAYCARFAETTFDESRHAANVARMLGCAFVPVTVSSEDFPCMLGHLIATTGELLADPAWVPEALVARRAAQDVPMLLGGEGADELFGGYPTYLGARWATHYRRLPKLVRDALRSVIGRLPVNDRNMTIPFMLKRFVEGERLDGLVRHRSWNAAMPPRLLAEIGMDVPAASCTDATTLGVMDAIQRDDFTRSLPEKLLAKADRGGMCYGVEVRAPFLDHAVVEFAASLPASARVRGLTTKAFLKRYAGGYLPRWVTHRRKRGLSVPLGAWLRGPLHAWARARLAADVLQEAGIDTPVALRLLSEHCVGGRDHARAIWVLVVLSEWLEWRVRHADRCATASSPATAPPGYVVE